jgi:hypothetical protein
LLICFDPPTRKEIFEVSFNCKKWFEIVENGGPTKVSQFPHDAADWLAVRKAEAAKIDPDLAEVYWDYGKYADPYHLYPNMPDWALDTDDRDDQCCGNSQCEDPLCTYRTIYFVRNPYSETMVHTGDLCEGLNTALFNRLHFQDHRFAFIRDVATPIRPHRYHRRCSAVAGSLTINHDRAIRYSPPMEREEWRKRVKAVAAEIDPKTADVSRLICCGDLLLDEADVPTGEPREFFFYRDPGKRVWVPETGIAQELNDKIKRRIKRRRTNVLWMDLCDD